MVATPLVWRPCAALRLVSASEHGLPLRVRHRARSDVGEIRTLGLQHDGLQRGVVVEIDADRVLARGADGAGASAEVEQQIRERDEGRELRALDEARLRRALRSRDVRGRVDLGKEGALGGAVLEGGGARLRPRERGLRIVAERDVDDVGESEAAVARGDVRRAERWSCDWSRAPAGRRLWVASRGRQARGRWRGFRRSTAPCASTRRERARVRWAPGLLSIACGRATAEPARGEERRDAPCSDPPFRRSPADGMAVRSHNPSPTLPYVPRASRVDGVTLRGGAKISSPAIRDEWKANAKSLGGTKHTDLTEKHRYSDFVRICVFQSDPCVSSYPSSAYPLRTTAPPRASPPSTSRSRSTSSARRSAPGGNPCRCTSCTDPSAGATADPSRRRSARRARSRAG